MYNQVHDNWYQETFRSMGDSMAGSEKITSKLVELNTKMVEMKKQSDDLASTMLTKEVFYSVMDSYFSKKNCSRGDPVGDSKITSKSSDEEDPTKSIGISDLISTSVAQPYYFEDSSVVTLEEAKSIPTSIQQDSSSQTLIKVESQKVDLISAGAVKDNDGSFDSMNSQFNEATEATANAFIKISQVKIVEVSCEEFKSLKELLSTLYNKSNDVCVDCCSFLLDDTRSLFDSITEKVQWGFGL
ncbi:uncharacterized protein LOC113318868 isoform X2 [Papaver somniferum]|uniref:uncharacterized protein LOC113318868 isoform X2 n=1 Tax=Papaver somniferum TaxID=3469 RepID=UPI000E6FAE9B|nr:uncharacterized protein LOC113318868 isoform X2 [Papaver somniferum]